MNNTLKLIIYFFIGGTVVTLCTYFGSKGSGRTAAFISMFPSISVITFFLIYRTSGEQAVQSYARGFLFSVPPWILYVMVVYLLCSRIGVLWSLSLGVSAYMASSYVLSLVSNAILK